MTNERTYRCRLGLQRNLGKIGKIGAFGDAKFELKTLGKVQGGEISISDSAVSALRRTVVGGPISPKMADLCLLFGGRFFPGFTYEDLHALNGPPRAIQFVGDFVVGQAFQPPQDNLFNCLLYTSPSPRDS